MEREGVVYALLAAALFGAGTPAAKLLLNTLSPVLLSAIFYLSAAAALWTYSWLRRAPSREARITRADLPLLGAISALGGALAPLLMLLGLRRLSAVSGSLLLNLEAPFTALIAVAVMGEHLGLREALAGAAITVGAVLIGLQPGALHSDWRGTLEIAAACLCWGLDNNLTQRISLRDPVAVAGVKSLAAGLAMLAIAWAAGARGGHWMPAVAGAAVVGALSYGVSLVLAVKALRLLGAARQAAYFATAPFIGALVSVLVFVQRPQLGELAGAGLMLAGVAVLMREQHGHRHRHQPLRHEHLHWHDLHHQHAHQGPLSEPHSHPHRHEPMSHDHPHVSDLHHRHSHRAPRGGR